MSRACQAYLDKGNDLGAARFEQETRVALYREDIAKYAGDRALPIEVKSGKGYKRHVALSNLLCSGEYGMHRLGSPSPTSNAPPISASSLSHPARYGGAIPNVGVNGLFAFAIGPSLQI